MRPTILLAGAILAGGRRTPDTANCMLTAVLTAAALVGMSVSAHALTLTAESDFHTFRSQSIDLPATTNHTHDQRFFDYRSLARFDPTLGTLHSAQIVISGSGRRTAAAEYRDDTLWSSTSGYVLMNDIGVSFFLPNFSATRGIADRSDSCSGTGSIFSGSSCTASFGSTSAFSTVDAVLTGSDLDAYIGAGSVDATIRQDGTFHFGETNGDDGYANTHGSSLRFDGVIRIAYDYTPVPEPTPLALLGTALASLGAAAQSRRGGPKTASPAES